MVKRWPRPRMKSVPDLIEIFWLESRTTKWLKCENEFKMLMIFLFWLCWFWCWIDFDVDLDVVVVVMTVVKKLTENRRILSLTKYYSTSKILISNFVHNIEKFYTHRNINSYFQFCTKSKNSTLTQIPNSWFIIPHSKNSPFKLEFSECGILKVEFWRENFCVNSRSWNFLKEEESERTKNFDEKFHIGIFWTKHFSKFEARFFWATAKGISVRKLVRATN